MTVGQSRVISDARTGVSFHEAMTGGFAMGPDDPAVGAGSPHATALSMRGHIAIDDIDAFVENPEHAAQLDVRFDWSPFGYDLDGSNGVFNLFSPSGEPDMRLMVYEWPASHQGRQYYFAGKKNVKHDPLRDIWRETTTLFTRLHDGPDATGPVIGAGILTLSMPEFLKMLSTFRAVDARTPADAARALAKFGRFFLGSLWGIYGPQGAPGS